MHFNLNVIKAVCANICVQDPHVQQTPTIVSRTNAAILARKGAKITPIDTSVCVTLDTLAIAARCVNRLYHAKLQWSSSSS